MGWFDTHHPARTLHCPVCAAPLRAWQGSHGPCAWLHWHEGRAAPTQCEREASLAQELAECGSADRLHSPWPPPVSLPERFSIYRHDCGCQCPV